MLNLMLSAIAIGIILPLGFFGFSAINSDLPTRAATKIAVSAQAVALQQAISAYKIANHGALPTEEADQSLPIDSLSAYLPASPNPPAGLAWSYLATPPAAEICLSGENISQAIFSGLSATAMLVPGSILAWHCTDTTPNETLSTSTALIFPVD